MKRTKENWKESQPENRNGISGLETFDGEDVKFETRKKHQQEEQKKWIEEQKIEKELRKKREKDEEMLYSRELLYGNRQRGIVEDKVREAQNMMQVSVRDANLQLKTEKEQREKFEKMQKIREEQEDLKYQQDIRRKGVY